MNMQRKSKDEFALDARNFVVSNTHGILSTISESQKGYPFGSVTPYDINNNGDIFIYISFLAEHYKNLVVDARASLCVIDPFGVLNAQSHARATLVLDFSPPDETQKAGIMAAYEKRFPNSVSYELAHSFTFMVGKTKKVRWIGGFGDIGWIESERYLSATVDPLSYHAMDIIQHMNNDHADALVKICKSKCGKDAAMHQVKMVAVNSSGFKLQVRGETIPIEFASRVNSLDECRKAFVELSRSA